jgi:hypothetical protein
MKSAYVKSKRKLWESESSGFCGTDFTGTRSSSWSLYGRKIEKYILDIVFLPLFSREI